MDTNFKQDVLAKLLEYGDSVLEDTEVNASKTLTGKLRGPHQTLHGKVKKKKLKKKKKKKANSSDRSEASQVSVVKEKHSAMKDFEEELRMFRESTRKEIPAKEIAELDRRKEAEERKTKKRKAPEVIVFEDPTKRKHERRARSEPRTDRNGRGDGEMDLEDPLEFDKARHDVWKFGIGGFSFEDREKHQVAKAIQLGAKAPRRDYVNYKEMMETQKQKKIEEQQQREMDRQMGLKTTKNKNEKIQLRNRGFWSDPTQRKGVYIDGQLGKYKRGVQVITKKDMAKFKNQRGKGGRR